MKKLHVGCILLVIASTSALPAQADFPAGAEGELYFAPRIDLVPAGEGGPYTITLDGVLDEPAWERAAFHGWSNTADEVRNLDPAEEDNDFIWAAVADRNFLYVAWKVADDNRVGCADALDCPGVISESVGCNVWQDDSLEVYIDADNNGPDCEADAASCYGPDDVQLTVGVDQIGKTDPELLQFGGVGAAGVCDFTVAAPEVMKGVVINLMQGDIDIPFGDGSPAGWQAEIAIALDTIGNGDDGSPAWTLNPSHGTCMGFNMQANDDDDDSPGTDRDHKLIWSLKEVTETSWRNPGAFGKLQFIDPTRPLPTICPEPVRNVACQRNGNGTVTVTWDNPASADVAVPTQILVDDVKVTEVPGDAATVELTEAQVPKDNQDHTVTVINNSTIPQGCLVVGKSFTDCSAIRFWNILGAYDNPGASVPSDVQLRADYMTDGSVGELDFEWSPGATIDTAFGMEAASTTIDGGPAGRNPGGVPTVFDWQDADGRVNFQQAFGGNLDNVMGYAQCYVINNTGADIPNVYLGISSDDSVIVYLNEEEVWWNIIGRGATSPCLAQDHSPDFDKFQEPFTLVKGVNTLLLKVFDGTGDWEFGIRFETEERAPLNVEDISIELTPPATGTGFRRGDADVNGSVNITDAVRILNVLFLGIGTIDCDDAADADDNGSVNITDAVRILNVLFLGLGVIPAPGADNCGVDPTDESIGCASYPPAC